MRSDERNGSSVLERAFRLLDAIQPTGSELGLAELARRAQLPKATAYRLAGQLVELGALEKTGERYRLGERLLDLGTSIARQRRLREAAIPFMEDLYEATRETVNIGVLDGDEVLVIERIAGSRSAPPGTTTGSRVPLHCSALGKAILAHSSTDFLKSFCERGLVPRTPRTVRTAEALRRELSTIAHRDVAYDHEEHTIGLTAVAAPLTDRNGEALAALCISGPTTRFIPERSATAVRTAALALTRSLRGQPFLD